MATPLQPNPEIGTPLPRVEISYEVEMGGGTVEKRQLPFVIGIIADLEGHNSSVPPLRAKRFRRIEADDFSRHLFSIAPSLRLKVAAPVSPEPDVKLAVELTFRDLADFEPRPVAAQIPCLKDLLDLRINLDNLRSAVHASDKLDEFLQDILLTMAPAPSADAEHPWTPAIDRVLDLGVFGRLEEERDAARLWLEAFFLEVAAGRTIAAPDTQAILTERIGAIDELLSRQLNEVLHHPDFQRLEASWRGLHYVVNHTPTSRDVRVEFLASSKQHLLRDIERAVEFDQTELFKKIYEEPYGTYGGEPFAALIGDFEFDRSPADVRLLEGLSNIAAASSAPFIAAASPALFNLEDFRDLSRPRDLTKIFDNDVYFRWHTFRKSDDARFVGLVLPRVLVRLPYGRRGQPAEGFDYEEGVDGSDHSKYLWGNAAYPFAVRLIQAFDRYGWCAAITGPERGGTVPDLPLHTFLSDEGDVVLQCPTEIAITDRRRFELERLGFIPLCYRKGSAQAAFFQAHSCQKPPVYLEDRDTVAARQWAQLEYVFAAARFTHYVRCMLRDKSGTFRTPEECEDYLKRWFAGYVLLDANAPDEVKARFPLREVRIELHEIPGRPGCYTATAYMRPHFQLAAMEQSIPLDARVPLYPAKG